LVVAAMSLYLIIRQPNKISTAYHIICKVKPQKLDKSVYATTVRCQGCNLYGLPWSATQEGNGVYFCFLSAARFFHSSAIVFWQAEMVG
jgi:hypothetical protein